jgi:hypothetical protein
VGKHVHHAGRRQIVAVIVHEHRRVARQRCRIAGNVDDPLGGPSPGSALTSSMAPSRGGSIRTLSSGPSASKLSGVAANRIGHAKRRLSRKAVERRILRRALDERSTPSIPQAAPQRLASGSVKLPMPQKKSAMPLSRARVDERNRAANQHTVDLGIDLRELRRRVGELEIELG